MKAIVNLYTDKPNQLSKFLSSFYNSDFNELKDCLKWEKDYSNPIEIAEIVGAFADNIDDFSLTMWISLDKDVFINITEENVNDIIKYLYERFPY